MSISTECKNKQCRDKEGEVGVGARGEDQWGDKGEECFLATQQQQHKNSVRSQGSQDEHQVCLRTPKLIHKTSNSGVNSSALDYCNENSSMGSELDETDNEVKWFTDLAFKSLSSPQVDYLDVYNSSHRSSTNISQQSTEDSTGVTAWSAYADLRGSTRQENDDPSRHPPSLLPSSCLNRAKRFEMGSFECVDVALESRDETRRGKRTVPKRQIQLRRRDTSESRASENSEVAAETASTTRHSKDILLRQHSTPAAMQEEPFRTECNTDSNERKQKLQNYDERESFSPLLLTNPPARRPHRYHPTSHVPLCSCTPGSPLSPAYPSPRPFGVPPLASPPVRMQDPAYPLAPPPARQCQHRSDAQSLCSQPSSPQTSQPSDTQAPVMFHALQHTPSLPPCPGHLLQPRPEDSRQAPPSLQVDRRAPHHRTPQQATQLVGGSPYNHNAHSPNVSSIETRPQYLCSPQGFAASYSPEYGSEGTGSSGMLYPDSGSSLAYGQNPRRVLLDPETGKYFYIEVPVQPLRKMLFDPETGQYVEVLIPHQTLSQSALFSPSAVPYPSLHNPSMYTPQYMPYSVPSHPPTQPPRHPEVPPPQALHDNEAGFGSSGTQGPKPEAQSHPPLDQNYLESMYYIPTGMTASPNPTSSDFYHKLPPSLPNSEAKRS
ncbi:serine/arginine repetitive matrix protein 2-like [Arapaima gigas]